MIDPLAMVHPLAHVADSDVGAGSQIWQFASVIRGAVIGADCTIASGALVDGSRICDRSIVSQNVAMGPGFLVGEDVFIGPNVTLCNDSWPRASKQGFAGFAPASCYASAAQSEDHMAIVIGPGASIGANAVILPGVRIGAGAMIAAGSVVGGSVPDDFMYMRDGSLRSITGKCETRMLAARVRRAP